MNDKNSANLKMSNSSLANSSLSLSDIEDAEMSIITINYYKIKIEILSIGYEVIV